MKIIINGQEFDEQAMVDHTEKNKDSLDPSIFDELSRKTTAQVDFDDRIEVTMEVNDLTQPTKDFMIGFGFKF